MHGEEIHLAAERVAGEIGGERGNGDRRQGARDVAPEDEFVAIERAGEGRIECGRNRGAGTRGHEHAQVRAAQAEHAAEPRKERGAHLAVGGFHAERRAGSVRDHRRGQEAQTGTDRHASAVKRVRLDRVDDVGREAAAEEKRAAAEDDAADRRDEEEAQCRDLRRVAEELSGLEAEVDDVQPFDEAVEQAGHAADHKSDESASEDLGEVAGANVAQEHPVLNAKPAPGARRPPRKGLGRGRGQRT